LWCAAKPQLTSLLKWKYLVFSETTVIPNGITEEQVEPAGFNDLKASQLPTQNTL
jgi:hypothetical protein